MDTEPDYSEQWRDLRRRRLIVALLAICTMVFILVNLIELPRIWVDGAFYIVFGGWMVGVFLASRRPMTFLCPRCRYPFFRTSWYHNPLATKCVHCGLPKWANSQDAARVRNG
jgi:hypothetical protein